jgi:PhnB protein
MAFHAYVFFSGGQCREAFNRYREIFGGDLQVLTNAELPEGTETMPGAAPEHVMHASLRTRDGLLMGSDDPTGDGGPRLGISVTYSATDEKDGKRVFDALCEGGELQMPFEPTFWSKGFGVCVDRFGVPWMVDVEAAAEG